VHRAPFLYLALLRLPAQASLENTWLLMDALRCTARLGLRQNHPEAWSAMKPSFDKACVRSLHHFKLNGQTVGQWHKIH
jgi:hypothetical protein